jgi:hypothetical protein
LKKKEEEEEEEEEEHYATLQFYIEIEDKSK